MEDEEAIEGYIEVCDAVDSICRLCNIPSFRLGMNDNEIPEVCRWIGHHAPNSIIEDGKHIISYEGFDAMVFITITEFPRFFEKHQLGMVWRN